MAIKIKEHVISNNIVPVLVALIAAGSSYFANSNDIKSKIDFLEKKVSTIPNEQVIDLKIKNMEDKLQIYNDNQKAINDMILKKMADSTADETMKKQFEYYRYNNYKIHLDSKKLNIKK